MASRFFSSIFSSKKDPSMSAEDAALDESSAAPARRESVETRSNPPSPGPAPPPGADPGPEPAEAHIGEINIPKRLPASAAPESAEPLGERRSSAAASTTEGDQVPSESEAGASRRDAVDDSASGPRNPDSSGTTSAPGSSSSSPSPASGTVSSLESAELAGLASPPSSRSSRAMSTDTSLFSFFGIGRSTKPKKADHSRGRAGTDGAGEELRIDPTLLRPEELRAYVDGLCEARDVAMEQLARYRDQSLQLERLSELLLKVTEEKEALKSELAVVRRRLHGSPPSTNSGSGGSGVGGSGAASSAAAPTSSSTTTATAAAAAAEPATPSDEVVLSRKELGMLAWQTAASSGRPLTLPKLVSTVMGSRRVPDAVAEETEGAGDEGGRPPAETHPSTTALEEEIERLRQELASARVLAAEADFNRASRETEAHKRLVAHEAQLRSQVQDSERSRREASAELQNVRAKVVELSSSLEALRVDNQRLRVEASRLRFAASSSKKGAGTDSSASARARPAPTGAPSSPATPAGAASPPEAVSTASVASSSVPATRESTPGAASPVAPTIPTPTSTGGPRPLIRGKSGILGAQSIEEWSSRLAASAGEDSIVGAGGGRSPRASALSRDSPRGSNRISTATPSSPLALSGSAVGPVGTLDLGLLPAARTANTRGAGESADGVTPPSSVHAPASTAVVTGGGRRHRRVVTDLPVQVRGGLGLSPRSPIAMFLDPESEGSATSAESARPSEDARAQETGAPKEDHLVSLELTAGNWGAGHDSEPPQVLAGGPPTTERPSPVLARSPPSMGADGLASSPRVGAATSAMQLEIEAGAVEPVLRTPEANSSPHGPRGSGNYTVSRLDLPGPGVDTVEEADEEEEEEEDVEDSDDEADGDASELGRVRPEPGTDVTPVEDLDALVADLSARPGNTSPRLPMPSDRAGSESDATEGSEDSIPGTPLFPRREPAATQSDRIAESTAASVAAGVSSGAETPPARPLEAAHSSSSLVHRLGSQRRMPPLLSARSISMSSIPVDASPRRSLSGPAAKALSDKLAPEVATPAAVATPDQESSPGSEITSHRNLAAARPETTSATIDSAGADAPAPRLVPAKGDETTDGVTAREPSVRPISVPSDSVELVPGRKPSRRGGPYQTIGSSRSESDATTVQTALLRVPLFRALDVRERRTLERFLKVKRFQDADRVFSPEDGPDAFFIILDGTVSVYDTLRKGNAALSSTERRLGAELRAPPSEGESVGRVTPTDVGGAIRRFKRGDYFVGDSIRDAVAVARGPVRCMVLLNGTLNSLLLLIGGTRRIQQQKELMRHQSSTAADEHPSAKGATIGVLLADPAVVARSRAHAESEARVREAEAISSRVRSRLQRTETGSEFIAGLRDCAALLVDRDLPIPPIQWADDPSDDLDQAFRDMLRESGMLLNGELKSLGSEELRANLLDELSKTVREEWSALVRVREPAPATPGKGAGIGTHIDTVEGTSRTSDASAGDAVHDAVASPRTDPIAADPTTSEALLEPELPAVHEEFTRSELEFLVSEVVAHVVIASSRTHTGGDSFAQCNVLFAKPELVVLTAEPGSSPETDITIRGTDVEIHSVNIYRVIHFDDDLNAEVWAVLRTELVETISFRDVNAHEVRRLRLLATRSPMRPARSLSSDESDFGDPADRAFPPTPLARPPPPVPSPPSASASLPTEAVSRKSTFGTIGRLFGFGRRSDEQDKPDGASAPSAPAAAPSGSNDGEGDGGWVSVDTSAAANPSEAADWVHEPAGGAGAGAGAGAGVGGSRAPGPRFFSPGRALQSADRTSQAGTPPMTRRRHARDLFRLAGEAAQGAKWADMLQVEIDAPAGDSRASSPRLGPANAHGLRSPTTGEEIPDHEGSWSRQLPSTSERILRITIHVLR